MFKLLGFDRDDPEDLECLVKILFNICLWLIFIGASVIVISAIFKDGSFPPEPEWWITFRLFLLSQFGS